VREGAPARPRVLVVAPLSGHFATLLRDTVRALLADHDVWITDWVDAKEIPVTFGAFHFDDYVGYVREFIRHVGAPDVHVISVCQPTVPVLAAVSLMAAAKEPLPKTLTMMGGPIDTRRSPTQVNNFAKNRPLSWFEGKVIQRVPMRFPGFMRRVYPGFLQFAGFVAMNPDRHMESHMQYYQHLVEGDGEQRRRPPPLLRRVQRGDGPSRRVLPGDGRARVPEAPAAAGQAVGRGRARAARGHQGLGAAHDRGRARRHLRQRPDRGGARACARASPRRAASTSSPRASGHYGIFSGRKYREMIYPRIREFIAAHD
jgi:poly(3-hydroxybutyrate) depolymerase